MSARIETFPSFRRLSWISRLNAGALAAIVGALSLFLFPAWKRDPDLQHGLFIPILCLILLAESRRDPLPRFFDSGQAGDWAAVGCVFVSLATLAVAGIYAAVLEWSHALVEFMVASSVIFLLGAAWLTFADRRLRGVPASWPVAAAIVLWFLAVPIPPGTYSSFTMLLRNGVTSCVVNSLQIAGIPAHQAGNVIELARTDLGVDEACSGVRSLMASVAAGLFISSVFAADLRTRLLIILTAPLTALALNFVRSLILAWLASRGTTIAGPWHDGTGLAIIVLTTGLLVLIASRCGDRPFRYPPSARRMAEILPSTRRQGFLAGGLVCYGALALTFVCNGITTKAPDMAGPTLDVEELMPPAPTGWKMKTVTHLEAAQSILRTKALASRTYWIENAAKPTEITFYLAYWRPGEAPVSLVAAHTPDACWPGNGWLAQPASQQEILPRMEGRTVPEAQCRAFAREGHLLHVWFWHLVGGRPVNDQNPYSLFRFLNLALKFGFQPPHEQLFVRISSNRPWDEIATQEVVKSLFTQLQPQGL